MALSRDQILGADDLGLVEVSVPEWGGSVSLRVMRGHERDAFEVRMSAEDRANVRARLAALSIVDEAGVRLFSDDDIEALGEKSASALNRVFERAMSLNGFTDADVEALEGN